MSLRLANVLGAIALLASCTQTTGGQLVDFPVAAAGVVDAKDGVYTFATDGGFSISLARAELHLGAIYLVDTAPISGSQGGSCVLPGTYVAQMTSGFRVNLLTTAPARAPALGHGTTERALVGQVWLTGGDVDALDDRTEVLVLEGVATRGAESRRFSAKVTIGQNRQTGSGVAVGANPICKQRIVPVLTNLVVSPTGGLVLRVDVRELLSNVDWSVVTATTDEVYTFADTASGDQPSKNLYANLHAGTGSASPFAFTWSEAP